MRKKYVKKKKKTFSKKKTRTFTAVDGQNVRMLADQLGELLTKDGYKSTFSLKTVAKKMGLSKFVPEEESKKEVFAGFIKNLIQKKPRTLKKFIREILPQAIEKRHRRGSPVLQEEVFNLGEQLFKVGTDLRKEIRELKLPTERPKVAPPPPNVQKILTEFPLHPILLPDCKEMFVNGHLNESVRKSLEKFEKTVQDLSTLNDLDGQKLMAAAFSEENPKIRLNKLKNTQEKNEQTGFRFVAMGLMTWWRNNLSHGDEDQMSHHEAVGRLIMVSNLFSRLDERVI